MRSPVSAEVRPITISLLRQSTADGPNAAEMNGNVTSINSGTCANAATIGPGSASATYGRASNGARTASRHNDTSVPALVGAVSTITT